MLDYFLFVIASLTVADLQHNNLDVASKQVLQDAVKSKSGFELKFTFGSLLIEFADK